MKPLINWRERPALQIAKPLWKYHAENRLNCTPTFARFESDFLENFLQNNSRCAVNEERLPLSTIKNTVGDVRSLPDLLGKNAGAKVDDKNTPSSRSVSDNTM